MVTARTMQTAGGGVGPSIRSLHREVEMGISAALFSGSKCYFFDGARYIRVTRGDEGPGTVDAGYPKPIAQWGWPAGFGQQGIDAALYAGSKCYFFDGNRYIRVTRGDVGPGTVDPGYSKRIRDVWNWPDGFGVGERVVVFFKTLLPLSAGVQSLIDTQYREMRRLFLKFGIEVFFGNVEDLSGNADLEDFLALDVGPCLLGQPTAEHDVLFAQRTGAGPDDLVVYIVQTLEGDNDNLLGCATHPAGRPGAAIVPTPALWLTAHEIGHVLDLRHVCEFPSDTNPNPSTPCVVGSTQSNNLMFPRMAWTSPPPNISATEAALMLASSLSKPI
jgi:hypothetical protein